MVAKLNRLTHKITIQLPLVAESYIFFSSPEGQSGNFWIYPRIIFIFYLPGEKITLRGNVTIFSSNLEGGKVGALTSCISPEKGLQMAGELREKND
jgi:hypothetical protein